jgi:transposase InsO family protein
MPSSYLTERANLYVLVTTCPHWTQPQFAQALGTSLGWVKKWMKRLRVGRAAGLPVAQILQGLSRARKTPPPTTSAFMVEQILAIRDHPPEGLRRTPGPKAIHYYLQRDDVLALFPEPLPSLKTIYRILKAHDRIAQKRPRDPEPMERPHPMTCWQIDFKDVSSVPADPDGKKQHVVETLNIIDMGTSILLAAHVRADFTAETALQALSSTIELYGRPTCITLDRDPRWVGSPAGSDFPSALIRFGMCLDIEIKVCAPRHPQQNGFVERYNRTYQQECLALDRPHTVEEARTVTEAFVTHYNVQRPHQGISCGNQPPRTAFATLATLPPVPKQVDPDRWLNELDGWHVERKVNRHGMISIDLKHYSISSKWAGRRVSVELDASQRCLHVFLEQQHIKDLELRGLVGHPLSFEQFREHMQHQARAQARLRSLQDRRYRTDSPQRHRE